VARLQAVKARRDDAEVERTLAGLKAAAERDENLMPHFIECARAYVSVGEMCDVLRGVFGLYRETPFF
jgi:methylmalonyl-CoA mutase N-terminal domain/subunit